MKVITTNRLNRFWKNGVLPKIAEKLASSAVVNNLTTNIAGYALDARQGKALKDEIDKTNTGLSTLNSDLSTISADLDNGKQDVISHRLITTSDKPFANFSFLLNGSGYFPCILAVGGEVYIISFNALSTYIVKNPISQYHDEILKNLWCIQDNDGGTRIKIQTQSATEVNILTLRTNFPLYNSYIANS